MLHKVSIGQDRNKKDPHRGRKQSNLIHHDTIEIIEIKKIPIGDGNSMLCGVRLMYFI